MIGFEPSEEQRMLQDAARKFAGRELRDQARPADERGELAPEVTRSGWELGLLPASIPEAYGGFGERSVVAGALAAEELAWGDLAGALGLLSPNLVAFPILSCGSEAQRRGRLPAFCGDSWMAGSAALMEPQRSFDPAALRTVAAREGQSYRISGAKCWVPFAAEAETILVYATLDGRSEAFLVPSGAAGLRIVERDATMGLKALPLYTVELTSCEVPLDARLGGEAGCEAGALVAASRTALASLAVGVARAAYEYALDYAKKRQAFGEPIARRQSIAFMLAEMATELEAARLMVWEAAWLLDSGGDARRAAALAKGFADDMVLMVADRAVQILGGHGYIRDYPVEMWLRNARAFALLEGTAIV